MAISSSPKGHVRIDHHRITYAFSCLCLALVITATRNLLLKSDPIVQEVAAVCESPRYTVRTLSFDPLIQHIENFITPGEIRQLLSLASEDFSPSTTIFSNGTTTINEYRTSSTAFLPHDHHISQCILARAAEYQGFVDLAMMEDLQVTRYLHRQHFGVHYDWLQDPDGRHNRAFDRDTTFFATLEADCADCGTHFPLLNYDWGVEDSRWCRIVQCEGADGLVIKPLVGSAVFWRNLREDGVGDVRMLHAGLPVSDGYKTGLNIWTRREL